MALKSISPSKLFANLLDGEWLSRRGLTGPGTVNVMRIYHDDGCPCEAGAGLPDCTCHVVDYEIREFKGG